MRTKTAEGMADAVLLLLESIVRPLTGRLAALEAKPADPGPPGPAGADGRDGLGFDDLDVFFDGHRTITLEYKRGDLIKAWPIVLPYLRYAGGYVDDGRRYGPGDVVTFAGSLWHCGETTASRPGDGAPAWRLMVKKGRDGRDGGR